MIHKVAFAMVLFAATATSVQAMDVTQRVRDLISKGNPDEAKTLLKEAVSQTPDNKALYWLLVEVYLAEDNTSWALRTLHTLAAMAPSDCEPLLVIAWLNFLEGDVQTSVSLADDAACRVEGPSFARKYLILAKAHFAQNRTGEGLLYLRKAASSKRIYPDDRQTLTAMKATIDPGAVAPLRGKIEVHNGWTSNARAGSPMDRTSGTNNPSAYAKLDADLVFTAPTGRILRPEVEGNAVLQLFGATDVRDESTAYLNSKAGVVIGDDAPRALLLYNFDALLEFGGDRYDSGAVWFYNAHRGELELQLPHQLLIFGGGGKRAFREMGRTRIELDGGIGGHFAAGHSVGILAAFTFRSQDAKNDAYDLRGMTALLSGNIRIPRIFAIRTTVLVSVDNYPLSTGYFDASSPKTARTDALLKLSLTAFSSYFHSLRAGLGYDFAKRWSRAAPYAYMDHRIMLKLIYAFSLDPFLPKKERNRAHVKIFDDKTQEGFDQRIQDLIRQEDAARRSSSCVD